MTELKCDRKSLMINLGGGVVGDMGGFVAGTYKRGIDFIQIPTNTLIPGRCKRRREIGSGFQRV